MKKIKYLFVLIFLGAFLSCEDAYNIVQDGEFGEEATFKTVDDMELYLNGVYDYASDLAEIKFTAIITDELGVGNQNAGQDKELGGFILNSNEGLADNIWISQYSLINRANRLLRGATRITPDASEVDRYNSIIGQARALRAYGHFQLLTYFSTDLKDDNALGVILMDRVPDTFERLPRNTNGEVFALIESDLQFAEDNVIDRDMTTAPNSKPWTYISKNFVNALRARMYAYRGNYPLAKQYADLAINNAGVTLASAAATPFSAANFYNPTSTTNPYRRMWQDLSRGEIIFSLDRPAGTETVASIFYFNRTQFSGGPFHDMGRNLFNLMDSSAGNPLATGVVGDIRAYAFIDPTSKVDQAGPVITGVAGSAPYYTDNNQAFDVYKATDVLCIDKYPGKPGNDLGNDLKIFRLSEMYFIKAEALVAEGDLNGAATILKTIRDVRNKNGTAQPLPNYANATEAWADILKERRIELCFEGHRYIDLKRLGSLANVGIDRYSRDCESLGACSIDLTDYRFTMPIPINELNANPNMVQNPNY
ncbi:RagB/SusD family nutrient uptake outer membrane protein [Flavobacterium sp. XGLA_31]|uniref:RagB/SusD family nutrient uptake outer membrane protein n=1 Tax=Flavobacterium sp. XGLA_31 TaxID=3447666 RepID=UPI003F348226